MILTLTPNPAVDQACGVPVILDAHGEELRLGLQAKPLAIKPNAQELEDLVGRPLTCPETILEAARAIARSGIEIVIVSMGSDGAICVRGERAWRVHSPAIERQSTVGSGDSFVAGLAVGSCASSRRACGSRSCRSPRGSPTHAL